MKGSPAGHRHLRDGIVVQFLKEAEPLLHREVAARVAGALVMVAVTAPQVAAVRDIDVYFLRRSHQLHDKDFCLLFSSRSDDHNFRYLAHLDLSGSPASRPYREILQEAYRCEIREYFGFLKEKGKGTRRDGGSGVILTLTKMTL